jgi:L-ascorbate metabolism protein UlaG (beta-lactamase superfamily)
MSSHELRPVLTYIGGPTILIEIGKIRLLTDPAFDPAGTSYDKEEVPLAKTGSPALRVEEAPAIDAVLLSHDQHKDNLDNAGRAFLPSAGKVLTTNSGAQRLGGNAVGLAAWGSHIVTSEDGSQSVKVTATPARHGPPGSESYTGDVIGFCLEWDRCNGGIYISGDTVWFEGVEEVARRFRVETAILFLGAAVIEQVGPAHHTMTADEAVKATSALNASYVVPVHYDGWTHFSQGKEEVSEAFDAAGLTEKLKWLRPGHRTELH